MNHQYDQMSRGQLGYPTTVKDPTVADVDDALKALRKRADELKSKLACVDGWRLELTQIERMIGVVEKP